MHLKSGSLVLVRGEDRRAHQAQVLFRHYGTPDRFMVAWLDDPAPGYSDFADWVQEDRVEPVEQSHRWKRR